MTEVWANDGLVYMGERDSYDGPECLTVAEARTRAVALLRAARESERQQEQIRQACAQGHDMGPWMNGWPHGRKGVSRHCRRNGCTGWEWEAGWMPFAARPHGTLWGQPLECCGPGCEHCGAEQVGKAMRVMFAAVRPSLEGLLGVAVEGGGR